MRAFRFFQSHMSPFMPETWRRWIFDPKGAGGGVIVCCGNGHPSTLTGLPSSQHKIDEAGSVTPSVVCTWEGCTYHEFIVLDGWGMEGR